MELSSCVSAVGSQRRCWMTVGRMCRPETVDSEVSEMGLAKADAEMRRRIGEGQAAGVATAVVSAGEVVEACYGMLDVERRVEIQPDSLMRLYSLTKPVVGVAVMLLHEQGSLDLDAPVREWIPSFATLQVGDRSQPREPLATEITVRHLLTHTAGLAWGDELISPIIRLIHPLPTTVECSAACRWASNRAPGGTTASRSTCWGI